ncbi:two-component sensor kinase [Escherichia coli]|uniref:Two-component sensor kinase n=1 Tax=Escherichia coli TaxID=562 RepID=A0A377B231_ECOLX|nr:two-component sensor kinase [Escherichia coli]
MNNEPLRPDPDRLLEQTAAPHRGKLKVFFRCLCRRREDLGDAGRSPSDCGRKGWILWLAW